MAKKRVKAKADSKRAKAKPVKKAKAVKAESKAPQVHPPLKEALRHLEFLAEGSKVEEKINVR